MSTALAIFVKTPWLSPLKTRLADGLGQARALEFYHLSIKAIEDAVRHADVEPYWAVAEEDGLNHDLWDSFDAFYTGQGGLGDCQYRVYKALLERHDRVIMIGSDAPQISTEMINKTVFNMDGNDFVIGPTQDGGYYLFGGRRSLKKHVWTSIEYSQPTTRSDLIKNLPSLPYILKPLTDVDTKEDLLIVADEMPVPMSSKQENLVDWVKALD